MLDIFINAAGVIHIALNGSSFNETHRKTLAVLNMEEASVQELEAELARIQEVDSTFAWSAVSLQVFGEPLAIAQAQGEPG